MVVSKLWVVVLVSIGFTLGARIASAGEPLSGCEILTCEDGKVLCNDVSGLDESLGGASGKAVKCSLTHIPGVSCAEVAQCPRGTPVFGVAGLMLLASGLVLAGSLATRRRKRR